MQLQNVILNSIWMLMNSDDAYLNPVERGTGKEG